MTAAEDVHVTVEQDRPQRRATAAGVSPPSTVGEVAFSAQIASAVRALDDAGEIERTVARALQDRLGIDRVLFVRMADHGGETDANANAAGRDVGALDPTSFGTTSEHTDDALGVPPDWLGEAVIRDTSRGITFVSHDIDQDDRFSSSERATLRRQRVQAIVLAPLMDFDGPAVTLAAIAAEPRTWSGDEVRLIEQTLKRTWVAAERARRASDLHAQKEFAESIVATIHEPLLVLHDDLRVKSANPAFYDTFRVRAEETIGRRIYQLGNGQWDIPGLRGLLENVLPTDKVFNDYEVTHTFEDIGERTMLVNARRLDHVQLILLGIRDITGSALARREQARALGFLQTLLDTADVCIAVMRGEELRYTLVNAAYQKLAPGIEMIGQRLRDVFPATVSSGYEAEALRVLRSGTPHEIDALHVPIPSNPEATWHARTIRMPADGPGESSAGDGPASREPSVLVMAWDVTARTRAERALEESEARFRQLADSMPQLVWTASRDGQIRYFNRQIERFAGAEQVDNGEWTWSSMIHEDDRERTEAEWTTSLRTGRPHQIEHRVRMADGGYRWFLTRARLVGADRDAQWFGTATDIHDLKVAEQAVREAEERARIAQRVGGVGTFEWNIADNVNRWSPELETLYGLEPGGFGGNYDAWRDCVLPEDIERAEADVERSLECGQLDSEWRVRLPDGEIRWLEARGWVEHDEQGRPKRMIGVNLDITERKRHEQQMRTVMGELNHRVKNTLAVVQSMVTQTLERARDPEAFTQSISRRLQSMADAHSLLTQSEWRGADLERVVRTEFESHAAAAAGRWSIEGEPVHLGPKSVLSMHMVLHELATNAIKYGGLCDEGGRVDIRWSIEPSGDASERTSEAANEDQTAHLVIEWRETCPHAVTAPEETGFGSELIELLVTYDLSGEVERRFERDGLHCTMRVPTHALTGSVEPTFAPPAGMRPPAATTPDVHAAATDRSSTGAAAAANGAAPGSAYRVLLVEDSYTLARDLHRRLEAAGLDVVGPAPTLDKAFALIEAKPPHAAVLDVDLHGGKVYPLARHLTSIGVPYVLLTGYNVADLPEDLRAGAVIGKPVDVAALLKRVREFCEAGVPA